MGAPEKITKPRLKPRVPPTKQLYLISFFAIKHV